MTWRTKINIFVSLLGLIGLIVVLVTFAADQAIRMDKFVIPIYVAFFVIYISERASSIGTDILSDREAIELHTRMMNNFDRVPSLLSGARDIVYFRNTYDGLLYTISAINDAIDIKNTVLRYGSTSSVGAFEDVYERWILEKRNSVSRSPPCAWHEIVSIYFSENDPQRILSTDMQNLTDSYAFSLIDDCNNAIINMCLISFSNRPRELLFGHTFPTMLQGPVFLTRNENLINYFESYFNYWYNRCAENRDWLKA